ncbi:Aldolase-type TIM barrel [Niveomyces insectorum RCEF 264]|uniref:Aldolase-type TIM barrel n=1 Tax=Niveomyces insectorum RCEF 264 TaxID=1081102 RepID=A0A167Y585_9HYPO|nr:Aldolase-type TIM barrel [Niveomyces insectorum RCEF 264]
MASIPLRAVRQAAEHRQHLAKAFPWTSSPLLISAPMRVFSGPALAVAVARAGGLGFIGPGEMPESSLVDLAEAKAQLEKAPLPPAAAAETGPSSGSLLPVGVGFQVWNGNLQMATEAVRHHCPCAVWLFAPRDGQTELDRWTAGVRDASPGTQVWVQVGTLREALDAASSTTTPPDALVIQGAEAGGHGRAVDGMGLISLLPEIADAIANDKNDDIPLVAAGGIADGRGAVAVLGLGAAAVAMGTRFLASTEARINPAYQAEVVRASDGAATTGRTQLYNHLRGTFGWPAQYSPRGLLNQTWRDHKAGVPFDELKKRHDAAAKAGGSAAWGPDGRVATYVGASVGLVRDVKGAAAIIAQTREEMRDITKLLSNV